MSLKKIAITALAALTLGACVSSTETAAPDPAQDEDMPTIDEIIASGGKADLWDDIAICHYVCRATRAEQSGCWDQHQCASFCGEYATTLHDRALVAYVECAVENPLCYQDMESCMWGRLYPEPFQHTLRLDAYGFAADDGKPVYAQLDRPDVAVDTTVQNGSFSLELAGEMSFMDSLVLFYVDQDEDGVCTPGVDLTGSEHVGISGSWLDPSFHRSVTQDANMSGWECAYLNAQ